MADASGFLDFTLTFEGQETLVGRFAAWDAKIGDMSLAWEEVGNTLLRDFSYQFHDEGDYLGEGIAPDWDDLAPSTQRDRARKGFGAAHPILHRTGDLELSATTRGANGNVFEVRPDGVTVGTEYWTAQFHQYGTSRMPERKMIGLKFSTRAEIRKIIGDFVRAAAWAAGFMAVGELSE